MRIQTWLATLRTRLARNSQRTRIRELKRQQFGPLAFIELLESRLYLDAVSWDGGGDGIH